MSSQQLPEHFDKNYADMLAAIRTCIAARQHLPALVLLYSLADSLAWAASAKTKNSVRANFEGFANQRLIPKLVAEAPAISATDLYSARCAVLHTLASESDLSNAGHAKRIVYAWGAAETWVLDAVIAETQFSGTMVSLHVESLLRAVEDSMSELVQSAQTDNELMERLKTAASKQFMSVPHKKS